MAFLCSTFYGRNKPTSLYKVSLLVFDMRLVRMTNVLVVSRFGGKRLLNTLNINVNVKGEIHIKGIC